MTKRKISLLAAVIVLGGLYAALSFLTAPEPIRTIALSERPDSILIEGKGGVSLLLAKAGDAWTVGDQHYPADSAAVESLISALDKIKVLDTVSSGDDAGRYGLDPEEGLTVTAKKGDVVLRTLRVGKTASTSQQTYVRLDGGSEILLASGDLNRAFGKKQDDLRDRVVLAFSPADLKAVGVKGKETYQLAKSGEPEIWKVASPRSDIDLRVDADKMDAWISSLSTLRAEGFAPEALRAEVFSAVSPIGELSLDLGSRTAKVTIHRKEADSKYLCSSSENPYPFYLSEYVVERTLKPREELLAK